MDDPRGIDSGRDALPKYADKAGDGDDAVTVSISTTPNEWLVNTNDAVVVPMSMAELVDALQKHKLTERSLVWRAGMQEWAPVDKVPQLKLAARLPVATPAPTPMAPPRPQNQAQPTPRSMPSRRATLPFGLPGTAAPVGGASARPSSPSRPAIVPPASDESDVLAVYARPAATVSFDLSPEKPLRAETVASAAPVRTGQGEPQTLAPLTSDSAQRRVTAPPSADLSVVAAAHFRHAQRSSKRLIVACSVASAAAASLLTFLIARHTPAPSATPQPATAAAPLSATPAVPSTEPAAVPLPAAVESATATTPAAHVGSSAPAKPKVARRPRVKSVAPRAAPVTTDVDPAAKQPSAEPNPYEGKAEEAAPKGSATAETPHGSGLEETPPADGQAPSGAATPGF